MQADADKSKYVTRSMTKMQLDWLYLFMTKEPAAATLMDMHKVNTGPV